MQDFNYHAPTSMNEALDALRGAEGGKVIAGGQSLLPIMKLNLAMPSDLVSLAGVPGLADITDNGDSVEVGAMCTHAQVAGSDVVRGRIPALAHMADGIGTRRSGTRARSGVRWPTTTPGQTTRPRVSPSARAS